MPGKELVCYYDSRERWLERNAVQLNSMPAIAEISYLLPRESEVIGTFSEVAAVVAESGGHSRIIEAGDMDGLCSVIQTASDHAVFWNMTDGFSPVTASYFPAFAAMTRRRYFGNSAALQLSIQNKFVQYLMCTQLGIPVPDTRLFDGDRYLSGGKDANIPQRLFVKPFDMANSIGIFPDAVCTTIEEASSIALRIKSYYRTKSLVQEYIRGASVRVNYIAVDREKPADERIGVHLMRGPPEEDADFTTYDDHLERFEHADAEYAAKATATDLAVRGASEADFADAMAGIRSDVEKLVRCFGLRDFFSLDYKVTTAGARYFIELNTLPFARNAGLKAYCRDTFGLTVGRALGVAIHECDAEAPQSEW